MMWQTLSRVLSFFIMMLSAANGFGIEDTSVQDNILPFQTLSKGDNSGIENAATKVFSTRAAFEEFRGGAGSASSLLPSLPLEVFDNRMVIAVFMGSRSTGGYGVEITSVDQKKDGLVVNFKTSAPAPGDMVSQAFTQPYHIVSVPTTDANVRFEGSEAARPPPPAHFPKFIITFTQGFDMDVVVTQIETHPTIKNVQLLRGVKIAFVDFDPLNTNKDEARQFLEDIEGVNSIEEE
eukprot:CAMPEP_0196131004 /NCGR_PEP_ID=MMETSP0910-20130528/1174_1 /TAXON_ID=49265 /ORGANISM="Thalassiosira rotula, Strain GSO102" /LENGTH=235 /DNA_ID=CAMNT_0041390407 /DNA_START=69 /DNA_END=776 /DNA_ORIENTATION=+